jgi:hypothetical protein
VAIPPNSRICNEPSGACRNPFQQKEGNLDAGETKEEPSKIDWLRGELENLRAQLEHVQDDIEKGKCKFQDLVFTLFSQTNTYP